MLQTIGVGDQYNLRLGYNDPNNVNIMTEAVPELIAKPAVFVPETMGRVRSQIQNHYDEMARRIMEGI